jgi:hypothetical protein
LEDAMKVKITVEVDIIPQHEDEPDATRIRRAYWAVSASLWDARQYNADYPYHVKSATALEPFGCGEGPYVIQTHFWDDGPDGDEENTYYLCTDGETFDQDPLRAARFRTREEAEEIAENYGGEAVVLLN